jgi:WD40 repeat protein
MVDAKRKRNYDVLVKSGLLDISASMKQQTKTKASHRGIAKKQKTQKKEPLLRRKSSRLAGVQAEGIYVESERSGKFTISSGTGGSVGVDYSPIPSEPEFFKGRIAKEGASLSIKDAVELCESKYIRDDSVDLATKFVSEDLSALQVKKRTATWSPSSVTAIDETLVKKVDSLSVDHNVKVTPDRIYSVACHPSADKLIVCAGDKQGYLGFWNVDNLSEDDGVHRFRVHGRPVSCLSWTPSGSSLLSASYDGSVRWFDVESQTFQEIFATYDDSDDYRDHLGAGLEQGYNYWTQYVCPDHRNASDQCFFMSTSYGTAMHVDLRVGKGKLTFHENLSEQKINTLR